GAQHSGQQADSNTAPIAGALDRNAPTAAARLTRPGRLSFLATSFSLGPEPRDYRPPFLRADFHKGAERLRRLLVSWKDRVAEIGEARAHPFIGQGFYGCCIELADDILRRRLWSKKPRPGGV